MSAGSIRRSTPRCGTGLPRSFRSARRITRTARFPSANQQEVVVGVRGGDHLGLRRAERARSISLLKPRVLIRGAVGAAPKRPRRTGAATVDVAPEDDRARGRATRKYRPKLGALRAVRAHLIGGAGGEVRRAHVDAGSGGYA